MLGAGIQTALRAIARGDIGEPLTATTMFHVPGPEAWHPNPDFLFAHGAGPLFDMGPYYVTTLVHAFGSAATCRRCRRGRWRRAPSRPGRGRARPSPSRSPPTTPRCIEFDGGQSAQSTFSFQHALPRSGFVEVNGTEGTIVLPDPNTFEGESTLWRNGSAEPETIPAVGSTYGRGSGVLDLARAIRSGGTERASGAVAAHVLDVLLAVRDAAAERRNPWRSPPRSRRWRRCRPTGTPPRRPSGDLRRKFVLHPFGPIGQGGGARQRR